MQPLSLDEACQHHSVFPCRLFQSTRIIILKVRIASQHQPDAGTGFLYLGVSGYEVVQVLFRHKTAHSQYVLSLFDAQFIEIFREITNLRLRHSVVYQTHVPGPSILFFYEVAYHVGNYNDLVSEHASHPFSESQHRFRRQSPLVAVVVRTMVCEHYFHT